MTPPRRGRLPGLRSVGYALFLFVATTACSSPFDTLAQLDDTEIDSDEIDADWISDTSVPTGQIAPVSVQPAFNQDGAPVDQVIRLRFREHLDVRTIQNALFRLYSGPLEKWLTVIYDPVPRELVIWPGSDMRAGVVWELSLREGMRDISGREVAAGVVARFITSEERSGEQPFPRTAWSQVAPVFAQHCQSCHSAPKPFAGLDMSDAEAWQRTALNAPSDGWPTAVRLMPYRPADSYLIRKILDDYPLRAGQQMPRTMEDADTRAPLTFDEQQIIAHWILSGAFLTN
ncbi:MAG: hypothetical protein M0R76_14370 [Proteobacteria bacterium]|nr:hypothetical protein [Pseudomonadota bacterium]